MRFADMSPDEGLDQGPQPGIAPSIVCAFVGEPPPISPSAWARLVACRQQRGRMLDDEEARSVVRADGAVDDHA